MFDSLRPHDTLIVDSFSRLSRSTKDLLEAVERLTAMRVNLISLKEQLDTTTATGKLMLTMLSALSQFERDIIVERTKDGLKAAKARGRLGGRPKADETKVKQALALYDSVTISIAEIANTIGISTATINRQIAERKYNNAKG